MVCKNVKVLQMKLHTRKIHLFMHYPGHCGSGEYPGNTGYEVGMHPKWDNRAPSTLIHMWGQFSVVIV